MAKRLLTPVGMPFIPDQLPFNEYDFIIVGSGPAGCVLANRLSANPNWQIALIEAGAEETIAHRVPLFAANLQATASNWNYVTERENGTCLGECPLSRIPLFAN